MSTLAELVKFKNDLRDTINDLSLDLIIAEKRRLVDTIKCRHDITDYHQDIEQYLLTYQRLLDENDIIVNLIKNTIEKINNDISDRMLSLAEEHKIKFNETTIHQLLSTNKEIEQIIQSRISKYSDWRFPGLHLHCRYHKPFNKSADILNNFANPVERINSMVANDPLYLVTNDIHHLKEITSVYSDVYQKRLRVYEIHNQNFSTLPHAQFGFILCWDFLNYLPIDVIKWYLESVMALLRPGGVFMFSYNNADIETSARLVDQKRACWATDSVIKKLATDAGFEIINFSDLAINDNENTWVSWAEIKKTGELRTVKVSQAMGQVLSK